MKPCQALILAEFPVRWHALDLRRSIQVLGATNMARVNVQTDIALFTLPGTAPPAQRPALRPLSKRLLKSIIAAAFCVGGAVCVQAQNSQQSGGDESWTTARDTAPQYANSSRTTESHTKSGNRTVDKQRMEFLGPNGGY